MSRLVLIPHPHPVVANDKYVVTFAVAIEREDVVIRLMTGNAPQPEIVSYVRSAGRLEDAIAQAIRIAQHHDYLIDDVVIRVDRSWIRV